MRPSPQAGSWWPAPRPTSPRGWSTPGDAIALRRRAAALCQPWWRQLEAALERFEVEVRDQRALDAGASTGGFTDCLLQRGVASVVAVDVGRGQLHERLRRDHRVTSIERTNIRTLTVAEVGRPVRPDRGRPVVHLVAHGGAGAGGRSGRTEGEPRGLVKPQFEAGRAEATKGRGVIRDPDIWRRALEGVASAFEAAGAAIMGAMTSPLTGADGNVEFLLHLHAHTPDRPAAVVDLGAVAAGATQRGS